MSWVIANVSTWLYTIEYNNTIELSILKLLLLLFLLLCNENNDNKIEVMIIKIIYNNYIWLLIIIIPWSVSSCRGRSSSRLPL